MDRLGLEVANVAATDLLLGPDVVSMLQDSVATRFVSANIRVNGERLFPPYVILERQLHGEVIRIGIVGVTAKSTAAHEAWPDSLALEFDDPIQAAREVLEPLRRETEIRILLAHLPVQALENYVLEEITGYDILISGAGEVRDFTALGRCPFVLSPGTSCKQLAWVNLKHFGPGHTEVTAGNVLNLAPTIEDDREFAGLVTRYAEILLEDRKRAAHEPTPEAQPGAVP